MQKAVIQDNPFNMDFSMPGVCTHSWFTFGSAAYSGLQMKRQKSLLRGHYSSKSISALQKLFVGENRSNDVPLANLKANRRDSITPQDPNDEELERHL